MLLSSMVALGLAQHTFGFRGEDFVLDGNPIQLVAGELHPARIPAEYWRHRIQMAKAMGCNAIGAYLFWNYLEPAEGKFDFKTGNRNVAQFFRIAQEEGMWVLLRPGPYVCAEWDFGGIPPYLLRYPDLKVRCMDPRYMKAAERYIRALAKVVKPQLITHGGPILMVQIENEYGSFGNDRVYMKRLAEVWRSAGVDVPFYTADGPTPYMLEAGSLPGAAVGLDSGSRLEHWDLARKMNPGVPIFSSETYPGWLTHWGEKYAKPSFQELWDEVKFLYQNNKSFSYYMIHGGTNFGFSAGANSGGKGYEPDITSYDYDAPISEQGRATPKYLALRELAQQLRPEAKLPPIPAPIPAITIPEFELKPFASIWNFVGKPQVTAQPQTFETLGQMQGFRLYRTKLIGHKTGTLKVQDLHDYATVFLDGKYIGNLDRREGKMSLAIPASSEAVPTLEILVEGMGRINFAQAMIDRKGITDRVTLNSMTLMQWESFGFSMEDQWVSSLKDTALDSRPGRFLKATFDLAEPHDTYIDTSGLKKGVLWVNGHNLGRYWEIGPQTRLYCPASWLKKGENTVIAFDLHQMEATKSRGWETLE